MYFTYILAIAGSAICSCPNFIPATKKSVSNNHGSLLIRQKYDRYDLDYYFQYSKNVLIILS